MLFQPKHVLPKPRKKETVNLRPGLNARNIEINYVRWVTGQHWSKAHLFNHRMIPDGGCRYCGLQLETREHIIFECTAPDIRDACLKFLKKAVKIVGILPIKKKNISKLIGSVFLNTLSHRQRVQMARALFEYIQDIEYYT